MILPVGRGFGQSLRESIKAVTEEIEIPDCIQRPLHFPFAHSDECCRLTARIFATAGLILFIVLVGGHFFPDTAGLGSLGLMSMLLFMLWHMGLLVKKFMTPCTCGRKLRTLAEFRRLVLWVSLIAGQMLFCQMLGVQRVLPDFWGANSANVLWGVLSFAVPAITLLYLARRIRTQVSSGRA